MDAFLNYPLPTLSLYDTDMQLKVIKTDITKCFTVSWDDAHWKAGITPWNRI